MFRRKASIAVAVVLITAFHHDCPADAADDEGLSQAKQAAVNTSPTADARTAADWPRFRGTQGTGHSDAKELPVSWSQDENVVWKTPLPGAGASSPIVLGDHIYVTSYSGYQVPGQPVLHKDCIAYCVNAATGEPLSEQRMNRAGQVYASTILAGGRINHLNRSGRTFVLAAKPVFELLSTNDLADGSQFSASPAVMGNRLLLRSDNFLYCIGE